jgi:hypothetical protein
LSRAEALYVEVTGSDRRLLGESILHFRAALEAQDNTLIARAREVLLSQILDLSASRNKP